jgi:hypothetical protein
MQLLILRYYQLRRDLGYWVPIIALTIFWICKEISADTIHAWVLSATLVFGFYQYHVNRKDKIFTRTYLAHGSVQVLLNYNVSLLPATVGMMWSGRWLQALCCHLLVSVIPVINTDIRFPKLRVAGKWVPAAHFEWLSGIRQHFFSIVFLSLLALFLSPVKLFGVAALFLLNCVFLGFYSLSEPRIMLNPHALPIRDFLARKTRFFLLAISLVNLPVLLINSIFNPEVTWINGGFLCGFLLLAANMVHIKYAGYEPNQNQGFSGDMLVLVTSIFIPYLLPVGILLYFHNRKKSRQHLTYYLDDHS